MESLSLEVFGVTIILNMKVMVIEITLSIEEYLSKIRPYLRHHK